MTIRRIHLVLLAGLVGLVGLAPGCALLPGHVPSSVPAEDAPKAMQKAEIALDRQDAEKALAWIRAALASPGLPTEQRDRAQILLESAAQMRLEQLSTPQSDPDDLADLVDLDLPRQIAVTAGMRAARRMFEKGEPMDAFKVLKKLDKKYPLHHERQAAGDLLVEIGLSMKDDGPGWLGLFTTRDEAQEVLEYAILNAPWAKRSDEAYAALSKLYEQDRDWSLAIDRAEKLVLNHPNSPLRKAIQAHIPELRLEALKTPEYDRTALVKARSELEEWLTAYKGDELESKVRLDLADCLRRLCDNDMIVSRFYARVNNAYGARMHAGRAVEEAHDAGDDTREKTAQSWLAELPEAKDPLAGQGNAP